MSATAVAASGFRTAIARYGRSRGLWLMLLVAPIGARFWIPRGDGTTITIAVNERMPVMTWPMVGLCLGIVVSTLLLPAAYIWLRANVTRRQSWQVEDVTAGSRVALALGRFAADAAILLALLAALTLAGIFLAWATLPTGGADPLGLAFALWAVAAPALVGLAALRQLWDALPITRGAFGDFLYFIVWIATLGVPIAAAKAPSSFAANMTDYAGFVRPIVQGSNVAEPNFIIGGADLPDRPRIPIDAIGGLTAPGYLAARAAWIGIAIALAAFAGLVYRPRRLKTGPRLVDRVAKLAAPGAPPLANPAAPPAGFSAAPALGLVFGQARLIGGGRIFLALAAAIALAGLFASYRDVVGPASLLLLVFAVSAEAGRSEARGLAPLTLTTATSLWARRAAFVVAATGWALAMALPAALADPSVLGTAALTGGIGAVAAILLAALSGSAFAPRLVLLIAWYGWTSA